MRLIFLGAFVLLLSAGNPVFGQLLESESGIMLFESRTQIDSFTSQTREISGTVNLNSAEVNFEVMMNSLSSGASRRDRHMHERHLETETYPTATFTGRLNDIPEFEPGIKTAISADGEFTLHGVTHNVTLEGFLLREDETWELGTRFTVSLEDYNISTPRFLLIRVQDEQEVEIGIVLRENGN